MRSLAERLQGDDSMQRVAEEDRWMVVQSWARARPLWLEESLARYEARALPKRVTARAARLA
jgi:hypothetical protein